MTDDDLTQLDPDASPAIDGDRSAPLLSVRDLSVSFTTDDGIVRAVDSVTFDIHDHETVGIVGESGSGKSVSSLAILRLLPKSATITGDIRFRGTIAVRALRAGDGEDPRAGDLDDLPGRARGAEPRVHGGEADHRGDPRPRRRRRQGRVRERAIELLDIVGIPNPSRRVDEYPHEYSGGMRQRAMIAMAIANDPALLIADEPTTALDVTIQAQVLEVLERIQDRTSSSIILITHDLGVVAGVVERVIVMYAGRQVEIGSVDDTFYEPQAPVHRRTARVAAPARPAIRQEQPAPPDRRSAAVADPHSRPGCAFHPRCPYAEVPGRCCVGASGARGRSDPTTGPACFFPERVGSLTEAPT